MSKQLSSHIGIPDLEDVICGPVLTVRQFEDKHTGTKGRMRGYIFRADLGVPDFEGLRGAVIRVGRTVLLDEGAVLAWMGTRTQQPKGAARNPHGRAGLKSGGCRG